MAEEYRIEIPIEVKDTSSQERLQKLESLLKQIQGSYKTTGQEAQKAGEKSGSAFREAGSEVDRFSQRVEKSRQSLAKAFKDKIKMTIAAIDKATPALKSIGATVKNITSKAWNVAVKMTDFVTAPFRKLKNLITSPIVMTLSMAGISMGAGSFVSTFSEFGASMSNVKALSGATNDEFQRLTATANHGPEPYYKNNMRVMCLDVIARERPQWNLKNINSGGKKPGNVLLNCLNEETPVSTR